MVERQQLIQQLIRKRKDLAEQTETVKSSRNELEEAKKKQERLERFIKSLDCIGSPIGYVLQKIDEEKFIIKEGGPRSVVGVRASLDTAKLKAGTRIYLDRTTHTIMGTLPREVDPAVHQMAAEDPGVVNYADVGGLTA